MKKPVAPLLFKIEEKISKFLVEQVCCCWLKDAGKRGAARSKQKLRNFHFLFFFFFSKLKHWITWMNLTASLPLVAAVFIFVQLLVGCSHFMNIVNSKSI
jgi:hypothetical protein